MHLSLLGVLHMASLARVEIVLVTAVVRVVNGTIVKVVPALSTSRTFTQPALPLSIGTLPSASRRKLVQVHSGSPLQHSARGVFCGDDGETSL